MESPNVAFDIQECLSRARVCSLPNTDEYCDEKTETPILDSIETPSQLKNLSVKVKSCVFLCHMQLNETQRACR